MKYTFTFLFIMSLIYGNKILAQETDSLKKEHIKYLSKDLSLTEATATQVVLIMNRYKENAKKIINNTKLSPEERKSGFDNLIEEKNKQLLKLLNDEQFKKLVPTTERSKNP